MVSDAGYQEVISKRGAGSQYSLVIITWVTWDRLSWALFNVVKCNNESCQIGSDKLLRRE